MSKIKIICTSTGCIEYAPKRYRNLGIDILRIHVFFEGKEYREGLDLDPVEFYERLETIEDPKNNLPKTGMPETEDGGAPAVDLGRVGSAATEVRLADGIVVLTKNFDSLSYHLSCFFFIFIVTHHQCWSLN